MAKEAGKPDRGLDGEFLDALKNGLSKPLLSLVKADSTLMLAIRDNYLNIYYRGGSLLKLASKGGSQYQAEFNWQYAENWPPEAQGSVFSQDEITALKERLSENDVIKTQEQVKLWLAAFPALKQIMDIWLTKHGKSEREFQQLVVRENNFSNLANQTDYFIVDIEAAYPGARFDLLAAKWPATQKDRRNDQVSLAFIEMKYGEKALTGEAGLTKHLEDVEKFLKAPGRLSGLHETVTTQLNQLNELGLLKHTRRDDRKFKFNEDQKPEVIMLLAGYPLQSRRLGNLFQEKKDELGRYANHERFALKFHWPHSAGYGLFCNDMITLEKFKNFLKLEPQPTGESRNPGF